IPSYSFQDAHSCFTNHGGLMRFSPCLTAVLLLVALTVVASAAAPPPGVVSGSVQDASKRPLAGARLRLETSVGQVVATTTTDDEGRFTFHKVPPGTYAVVGEQEGFEPATAPAMVTDIQGANVALVLASATLVLEPLHVVAKRLEEERIKVQPRLGASTYE